MSRRAWRPAVLGLGFGFLYLPLLTVAVYSFNASRLMTVWAGFSWRWYGALVEDQQILRATGVSLAAAFFSASIATAVGTAAGFALARFGRHRASPFLAAGVNAPLVMPEIMTGLSLLLLFIAAAQAWPWLPGRGLITIVIAHATVSLCYVAVIVQARLAGQDLTLEQAAADLGAPPAVVFWRITLPLMAPAVIAGWLLAFVISFDDLVIASFVAGPSSTTLPMVIFSSVRLGVSPKINALATILMAVTAALIGAAGLLVHASASRRSETVREK